MDLHLDKDCRWTEWDQYEEINFTTIYDKVLQSPVIKNFKQQDRSIVKKETRLDKVFSNSNSSVNSKLTRRMAKEASGKGMTFNGYVKCLQESLNRTIVSGKHHVARLTGLSATSGSRLLRKMAAQGVINRRVVYKHTNLTVAPAPWKCSRRK